MEPLKTTGIVLRTSRAKNSSLVLNVLSPDLGNIRVWARGAYNPQNPSHAGCALLTYGEFVLLPRREMYTLLSAAPLRTFYHIRESVEKLSYGVYFAELAGILSADGVEAEAPVRLLLNTLHYLEKDLKAPLDLKVLFELRILSAAGFAPYLDACMRCGNPDAAAFSPQDGGLLCSACSQVPPLPKGVLSLLRGYAEKGLKTALDHDGGDAARLLSPITEAFVRAQIDSYPRSLEYLHHIQNIVNEQT